MKKVIAVLLVFAIVLSCTFAQGANETKTESEGKYVGHYVGLAWTGLEIEFYSNLANVLKGQAEEAGCKVTVMDAKWDVANQIAQIENMATMGITDMIVLAIDQDALKDTLKMVRKDYGVNVHSFAYDFGGDTDCYDSVSVADQYAIGAAQAEAAYAWASEHFKDAVPESVKVAMIELPITTDDKTRDAGCRDAILAQPLFSLVEEVEIFEQDYATAQNAFDSILIKHPDINIVICHFATMAEGVDERAMAITTLDKENFAIISGDNNATLLERIKASKEGKSLVRGSGAYDVNGIFNMFGILMGEYPIDEKKRYAFDTFAITLDNVDQFTADI